MPDQTDQNIADNVKRLRDKHGLKQAELVEQLRANGLHDWHPTTLSRTESAERPVRLSEALVIAQVLGVTVEELGVNYSPAARAVEAAESGLQRVAQARGNLTAAREEYVSAWADFVGLIRTGSESAGDDPALRRRIKSVIGRAAGVKPSDETVREVEADRIADEFEGRDGRMRWEDDDTVSPAIASQDGLQAR